MAVLDNPAHELFAQELAKGTPARRAYVLAGYAANDGNSVRLKQNEAVAARVEELLAAAAERAEITREQVLRELGRIGFSDIRKMFSEHGNLKPVEDLDDDAAAALAAIEVVTRKVAGGDGDEVEHVAKIKTWDKRAALVDIAKMQGWIVDKHEHTGKDGGPIDLTDRELAELIVRQLTQASLQSEHTEPSETKH